MNQLFFVLWTLLVFGQQNQQNLNLYAKAEMKLSEFNNLLVLYSEKGKFDDAEVRIILPDPAPNLMSIHLEDVNKDRIFEKRWDHPPVFTVPEVKPAKEYIIKIASSFLSLPLKSESESREFVVRIWTHDGRYAETKPFKMVLEK